MNYNQQKMDPKAAAKLFATLGLLLVLALFVSAGFEIVNTGHRGVKTRFGKVTGDSLPEGLYFYNPLTSNIIEMDVREQKWQSNSNSYTKDVQNVKVDFAVNYHPDPSQMHVLYEKIGRDWDKKVLPQIIMGKIKEVIGKYEAVKLVSDREKATFAIKESIEKALLEKSVVLKNFEITDLNFNDLFENAVEAKVVAIQQAEEAKNKTVRVQEEANQKIISAKAEAQSMRIRSEALKKNKGLVEYEAVQKWNGILPQYMMGKSVPFLNLSTK
jgi:prohibitin 2